VKQQEGKKTTAKGSQVNNGATNQSGHSLNFAARLYGQACGFSPQKIRVGFKTSRRWVQVVPELGSSWYQVGSSFSKNRG